MNIIKAIVNDFKTDIQFLNKVSKGEYKFPYTMKEVLDIRPILKDPKTWAFFMILFVAVMVGTQISAKHYQKLANNEIIKAQEFVDNHCSNTSGGYNPEFNFLDIIEVEGEVNT